MKFDEERWLPVSGFELNYEVSSEGRVRSIRTNFGNPRLRSLKPQVTHDGYLYCVLSLNGERFKRHIAHLVLETFVGPRPPGMQACHGPAGKQVNTLPNLRWDTPEANYEDRSDTTTVIGETHHQASITEEVARKIKAKAKDRTILARDIAKEFGTTVSVVRNIRNNCSWRWL